MPAFEPIPASASLAPAGPGAGPMGPPPGPPGMGGPPPTLSGLGGGGVSRIIFDLKRQVKTLAASIPAAASEIAQIDRLLDGVMMKAIPGGGAGGGGGSDMLSQPTDAPF